MKRYLPLPRLCLLKHAESLQVAHGHILRAFTKRWLKYPMDFSFTMMMEPGAIGIMSYAHHNISEPAILIGMGSFRQPSLEKQPKLSAV